MKRVRLRRRFRRRPTGYGGQVGATRRNGSNVQRETFNAQPRKGFGAGRSTRAEKRNYCGETDMGGAVGRSFVETGIAETGSGDVGIVEDGGLLMGFADSDDTGVGGSLVTVGVETPVGDSGLLVEGGAVICGVDWVAGSWVP